MKIYWIKLLNTSSMALFYPSASSIKRYQPTLPYSIFQKYPNTFISFFIFKKYFGIFFLILINELCKTINSTHNIKSWKLKKRKYVKLGFKKMTFGFFWKILHQFVKKLCTLLTNRCDFPWQIFPRFLCVFHCAHLIGTNPNIVHTYIVS